MPFCSAKSSMQKNVHSGCAKQKNLNEKINEQDAHDEEKNDE